MSNDCALYRFTAIMSLENDQSAKYEPFSLSVFFFALACERTFIKRYTIECKCYKTLKYTVCRRIHAFFCPEIVEVGAVTG